MFFTRTKTDQYSRYVRRVFMRRSLRVSYLGIRRYIRCAEFLTSPIVHVRDHNPKHFTLPAHPDSATAAFHSSPLARSCLPLSPEPSSHPSSRYWSPVRRRQSAPTLTPLTRTSRRPPRRHAPRPRSRRLPPHSMHPHDAPRRSPRASRARPGHQHRRGPVGRGGPRSLARPG